MTIEVKIQKVSNGYIVTLLDFTGTSFIFETFADMMDFLFDYFLEHTELKK